MIDWKAAATAFHDRWRDADQAGMTLARENVRLRSELAESTARADRLAVENAELRDVLGDAVDAHTTDEVLARAMAVLNRPADTRGAEILAAADEMAVAIDGLLTTPCVVEWPSGSESLARYRALGVVGGGAR